MLEIDLRHQRGSFTLTAQVEIEAGVTGICGASGSGKSTLIALLAGLLRPTTGRLSFQGVTLADPQSRHFVPAWRRQFGLVFQEGLLFPHLSVRDNLLYGEKRLPASQRQLSLDSVLQLLEIAPLAHRRPVQLSGGERQRVAIGRALLSAPRLLLLDEPLSALDDRLKFQILPFLKRIKDELQIPMIYVSHQRSEVDFLADRVLWMTQGRLSTSG